MRNTENNNTVSADDAKIAATVTGSNAMSSSDSTQEQTTASKAAKVKTTTGKTTTVKATTDKATQAKTSKVKATQSTLKQSTVKQSKSKRSDAKTQSALKKASVKNKPKKIKPSKNMTRNQINTFFQRLREQRPEPKTELKYSSTFELLIAVMLSAQATDVSVNKATDILFPVANTPEQILALGVAGLKKYIKTIGLFNAKAENVIQTCARLIELHHGEVPDQREALEALPGVGRKTANVVLNTAFKQPAMAVDTHIFRLGNRTGLALGANVNQVEQRLMKVIPKAFILDAHHWLILHGRYCCTARSPKCGECIVSDVCNWPERFDHGAERIALKLLQDSNTQQESLQA